MADNGGQSRSTQSAPQTQNSLIRAEQVKKLPHLTEAQKGQHEALISRLWQTISSSPQGSEDYVKAYGSLSQISQKLMTQMKAFHAAQKARQSQQAANQTASQNAGNATAQAANNTILFSQLNPAIQQRVNEQHFYYPPQMVEGTRPAEDWLREAKARFGQALQRSEVAKSKKADFQRQAQQRQAAGSPLNQQEMEVFNNKLQQCQKAINEANSFMEKFREQQATFQRSQPASRFTNNNLVHGLGGGVGSGSNNEPPVTATMQGSAPAQGPQGHSIDSALTAARQAAAAQTVTSPRGSHAQPLQTATPVAQSTFTQASPYNNPQVQTDGGGVPRPPSQGMPGQPYPQQPHSATHAHPPALNNPIKKDDRQPISKHLQVTSPKPVTVPAARPTLTGGPSVGMAGQMGRPAIPEMPGYVLESSEDGRLLSKKKLNDLVREVCGPGGDEQLTPEVEDIFLQITDDFVDDLISDSCKLAKVRGSSTLDVRDIQVILERQYNIRIPGFSTDEIRTVRRPQPAAGWAHKMSAVQAAKLTGGINNAANGVKEN